MAIYKTFVQILQNTALAVAQHWLQLSVIVGEISQRGMKHLNDWNFMKHTLICT
jgi:hypothetical protein